MFMGGAQQMGALRKSSTFHSWVPPPLKQSSSVQIPKESATKSFEEVQPLWETI